MNIPDDKVTNYPDDDAILINDARIIKGALSLARTWGEEAIKEDGSSEITEADEIMAEFADAMVDLRAKHEVQGDLLNAETTDDSAYYDELNALLKKYRAVIFRTMLDFVSDDIAVDFMLDVFPDPR